MKNVLISNDSTFSTALLLQSLHEKGDLITFADVYHGIWLPKKKATISIKIAAESMKFLNRIMFLYGGIDYSFIITFLRVFVT